MRSALLILGALGLLSTPAAAQDIGGNYSVEGTNLDGSAYSGDAEITLLSETTCAIKWTTDGVTSSGFCMRNNDAFAASYTLNGATGLVLYKTNPDGSMQGLWTITGQPGSGTENLKPK